MIMLLSSGGETEIRTQERVAPLPVFKTGAFNHSAISPLMSVYWNNHKFSTKNYLNNFIKLIGSSLVQVSSYKITEYSDKIK